MSQARFNWRRLFRQKTDCPLVFALARTGNKSEARMAIMAITTSNSTSVKALRQLAGVRDPLLDHSFTTGKSSQDAPQCNQLFSFVFQGMGHETCCICNLAFAGMLAATCACATPVPPPI